METPDNEIRRRRCGNCTWFDPSDGGVCRRYPPPPNYAPPGVTRVKWCGEWAAAVDDDWEDLAPPGESASS